MLSDGAAEIFKQIDLLGKYAKLSEKYNVVKTMDIPEKEVLQLLLQKLSPKFKFHSKESFFGLTESDGEYQFKFNLGFKHGLVEPVIWGKNLSTKEQVGGAVAYSTMLIKHHSGAKDINMVPYPRFDNYEDAELICRELYDLYKEFKKALKAKGI